MIPKRILSILDSCTTDNPKFPPSHFFNGGWLLRLTIDWFSFNIVPNHPMNFSRGAIWFSEAILPSAFLKRQVGDPIDEGSTRVDGVIGHFVIGKRRKFDLSLLPNASQFVVLEAKISDELSQRVTKVPYYDQVARSVACMAEVLKRAKRNPSDIVGLGFYLIAPKNRIEKGEFDKELSRKSLQQKVGSRVCQYDGERDQWYSEWFLPSFQHIEIKLLSWEELIDTIKEEDEESGTSINQFYQECLKFN